jgi:hypothetical protein
VQDGATETCFNSTTGANDGDRSCHGGIFLFVLTDGGSFMRSILSRKIERDYITGSVSYRKISNCIEICKQKGITNGIAYAVLFILLLFNKSTLIPEPVHQPGFNGAPILIIISRFFLLTLSDYLSKNGSYATSRNGYKISHVNLEGLFKELLERYSSYM